MNIKVQVCLPATSVPLGHTVLLPELLPVHRVPLEHTVLITDFLPVDPVELEENLIPLGRAVVSCHHI